MEVAYFEGVGAGMPDDDVLPAGESPRREAFGRKHSFE